MIMSVLLLSSTSNTCIRNESCQALIARVVVVVVVVVMWYGTLRAVGAVSWEAGEPVGCSAAGEATGCGTGMSADGKELKSSTDGAGGDVKGDDGGVGETARAPVSANCVRIN
jgi:hypothetical protein